MYDQLYETRVRQAFTLAVDIATSKGLPYEVGRDIAQEVVIEQADNLFCDEWQETINSRAFENVKKAVKEFRKECRMKNKLRNTPPRDKANVYSKELVREMAPDALTARQWQVVHRMYWRELSMAEVGMELGITRMCVWYLHHDAMGNMRRALHRMGITKNNWHRWYYEGQI